MTGAASWMSISKMALAPIYLLIVLGTRDIQDLDTSDRRPSSGFENSISLIG